MEESGGEKEEVLEDSITHRWIWPVSGQAVGCNYWRGVGSPSTLPSPWYPSSTHASFGGKGEGGPSWAGSGGWESWEVEISAI